MFPFLHDYPYSDLHEIDLAYMQMLIIALEKNNKQLLEWKATHEAEYEELADKVEGLINSLVEVIEPWDSSVEYPIYSLVSWEDQNYIALQNVPVGVMITNTEYWQPANTVIQQINAIGVVTSEIQEKLRNMFILPEDHGAVGDGVADDSAAWQAAITEAMETGRPILGANKYYIGAGLQLAGENVTILCPGSLTAADNITLLTVNGSRHNIMLHNISGNGGTGIHLKKEDRTGGAVISFVTVKFNEMIGFDTGILCSALGSNTVGIQYNVFDFEYINANDTCIKYVIESGNWVTQQKFINGRLSGVNGVRIENAGDVSNSNYFENIGFEGLTGEPIYMQNVESSRFDNIRMAETASFSASPYWVEMYQCKDIDFNGNIILALNKVFDSNTNGEDRYAVLRRNHFKCLRIDNEYGGGWRGTEIYSYNGQFFMVDPMNNFPTQTIYQGGDVELTPAFLYNGFTFICNVDNSTGETNVIVPSFVYDKLDYFFLECRFKSGSGAINIKASGGQTILANSDIAVGTYRIERRANYWQAIKIS